MSETDDQNGQPNLDGSGTIEMGNMGKKGGPKYNQFIWWYYYDWVIIKYQE